MISHVPNAGPIVLSPWMLCARDHASAMEGARSIGTDGSKRSSQRAADMPRGFVGCGSGAGMAGEDFDVRTATPGSARVAIRISSARCFVRREREDDRELKRNVRCGLAVFG